jgi:serine/threonine-protein kinase RsbW
VAQDDWAGRGLEIQCPTVEVTQVPSTIRLELESRPSCVTLVRGMLTGLGETLALDPELLDDLKTAVSEACNNVVIHAYPDAPGPLVVELEVGRNELLATVRDRGGGIKQISAAEDRMGVGLAVISALADRAEFQSLPEGGTAVRMEFGDRGAGIKQWESPPMSTSPTAVRLTGDVVVTLSSARLLSGVLGRVARAAAAVANFSLDRFSDLYLITDEISAHAESSVRNGVSFAIAADAGQLDLTIGPFTTGTSARLAGAQQASDHSFPLARLVDRLTVESDGVAELLSVVVRDKPEDRRISTPSVV